MKKRCGSTSTTAQCIGHGLSGRAQPGIQIMKGETALLLSGGINENEESHRA